MSNPILLVENQQFIVVVPAAGVGKRMQASCPKQYLTLNEQTILSHTINRLLNHKNIAKVILAISDDDDYFMQTALLDNPNIIKVSGGEERVDSVLSGLQAINELDWVLVHDAARPCITHADIDKLISQCLENNTGGILAAPVVDTMKLAINKNDQVEQVDKTIDRSHLWHAFTPQMFKAKELKEAIIQAKEKGLVITDEASAIESVGLPCLLISGRRDNIKITRPEDLVLASFYLNQQEIEQEKDRKCG
ncbi:2-C-methyl-D-erythritol 4-phosphate cytidylyltransferase [Colwellia sp. 20A7]|uniref:2-C-methyl-D-erythritol 4-phosphate cytidylyltransferase n=1 Tax=Colwellia sp. 20A7 TaxID=2689569 RepID=UPI0022A6DF45|nr:2-C-methyl-D-erythritol 4-phosphate cytidylyltransferase [Colwellia sp. 20A7]